MQKKGAIAMLYLLSLRGLCFGLCPRRCKRKQLIIHACCYVRWCLLLCALVPVAMCAGACCYVLPNTGRGLYKIATVPSQNQSAMRVSRKALVTASTPVSAEAEGRAL